MGLFKRLHLPALIRRRLQTTLCLAGIAMGVAVMLGVDLATNSALKSFQQAVGTVRGRATHQILGGPGGIPDSVMKQVLITPGVGAATPVVEWLARSPDVGDQTLQMMGIDLFSDATFRQISSSELGPSGEFSAQHFLTTPRAVLLSREVMNRHGIVPGDTVRIFANALQHTLKVVGSFPGRVFGPGGEYRALMDIASAQVVGDQIGRLSTIDLILTDSDRTVRRLETRLPDGLRVRKPEDQIQRVSKLVDSYQMNLQAMSLLAVFVGMFLIYNTMMFSVLQRRSQISILRSLGATRGQIRKNIVLESALLGLAGSFLGLGIGTLLTRMLMTSVQTTVTDYYAFLRIGDLTLSVWPYIKALGLGVVATLVSAAVPAWEASLFTPHGLAIRSTLETRYHRSVGFISFLGACSLLLAFLLSRWQMSSLVPGFLAAFFVMLGFALSMPVFMKGFVRFLEPAIRRLFGVLGAMAGRNILANMSRTAVAVAALMVSLSMTIGMSIMINSFRTSVSDWINRAINSEFYISSKLHEGARFDSTIPPNIIDRIDSLRGVADIDVYTESELMYQGRPILVQAIYPHVLEKHSAFIFKEGDIHSPWTRVAEGDVIVSETFANRFAVSARDTVRLTTPGGPVPFRVAAIFRSYTSDWGQVMMSRAQLKQHWNETRANSLGIYTEPNINLEAFEQRLRTALSGFILRIYDHEGLRQQVLQVFDRTFSITVVLQILAMVVAFVGILSALMALLMERSRELALLRSMGLTRGQLQRLLWTESGLMGLMASLAAIPAGGVLSMVLIEVINMRSFGWTIDYAAPWDLFVKIALLAVAAALASAVYPVVRLNRLSVAAALRGE
jgi:putative ABC transport system permease protein